MATASKILKLLGTKPSTGDKNTTIMTSTTSSSTADMAGRLVKVQDMSQKLGVPDSIQYLMTVKGDQDFISIHEWAARLCHALIVETGFFPAFDGTPDISPREGLEMPDEIRIPRFVKKLKPDLMFSDRGVYTLKYRAILMELVDKPIVQTDESVDKVTAMEGTSAEDDIKKTEGDSPSRPNEFQDPHEWVSRFSEDVSVTMVIMEDRLLVTASYNPRDGSRNLNHQITINIEEFLSVRARLIPVRLRADQWIRKFDLNSARFSSFFKNKFSIFLMDKMNGMVFERRGLICLPELVLLNILKMSNIRTILNVGMTCFHFYETVRQDRLWQYLVKRDFSHSPILPGPSIVAPLTSTDEAKAKASPQEDFYEIYRQKYVAKHRGINRLNRYPIRFFQPDFPRTRRFPSTPFPFVRF